MKPILNIENLTKIYGNVPSQTKALNGITFQVMPGEFLGIMGSSGSGKSTLIKLLMKELDSTNGTITVSGERLEKMKHRRVAKYRRKLGVVFQDFRLLKDRTVFENIAFAQRIIGRSKREMIRNVTTMLTIVGLTDKADAYPNELSGGEQQRVAIARALAKNPKLLLCDEPTGALDYETGKAILKLLQDCSRKRGMTVVIITHNQALTAMADRIIKVKSGKIASVKMNEQIVPVEEIEW